MCGRYTGNDDASFDMKQIYTEAKQLYPNTNFASGEIFPTNTVPVLKNNNIPFPATWGFPGFKGKGIIINARAETAAEKYSFKDSLFNRRCVVPTTGYFEWDSNKTKYRFNLPDTTMLYLAGFYKQFPDGIRFVILTTTPSNSVAAIHNRMPLILDDTDSWINNTEWAMNRLNAVMPELSYMRA